MKTLPHWKGQRGEEVSSREVQKVRPNVVRDFRIGNTRIKIADNYCRNKTACEVEWILKSIAEQAQRQFNAAATAGKYGQQQDSYISADNR